MPTTSETQCRTQPRLLQKSNEFSISKAMLLQKLRKAPSLYDRVKGISFAQLDVPIAQATDEIIEDAEWMLDTYEPRAEIDSIEVTPTDAPNGHFAITAKINTIKEADA